VDIRDRDLGGYVADAQAAVKASIQFPAGAYVVWSGQFEYLERAAARLKIVVPVTLSIIFLLLYLNFRSFADTMIVMLSLPFALVGEIWLMWWLGFNLSVAVVVGFIALAGVAAETGVVMLIYLNHALAQIEARCDAEGRELTRRDLYDAIMEGAVERVRPKMMTVVAIMAALLPIMWSTGTGSEIMQRIAVPMIGGMISSTLLTLIVIPAIYGLVKERRLSSHNRAGDAPDVKRRQVAPASPGGYCLDTDAGGGLCRQLRHPLARLGAALRLTHGDVFDDHKMFRHNDALDQRRRCTGQYYFFSRKRRFFVNLFRNKRRRFDRLWKRAEFARYLPERLLLVGPVQGGVVESLHDGGFDDFEIGRDVEIARHVERRIADVQDFAPRLLAAGARDLGQDRGAHGVERLRDQRRADDLGGIAGAERDHPPPPALRDRQRDQVAHQIEDVLGVVAEADPVDGVAAHRVAVLE